MKPEIFDDWIIAIVSRSQMNLSSLFRYFRKENGLLLVQCAQVSLLFNYSL